MAKEKTTMSVPEMQRMLGLKKTDAYWLVHKKVFDTILVEKKMRVVIDSFEKWYANQLRHSKVNGPPPGAELRAYSISVKERSAALDAPSMWLVLVAPTTGAVTRVSSQANEISVMETPRRSASSATRARMGAS